MKIEIEKLDGYFEVFIGDRRTGILSWDEMLGQIAKLTLTGEHLYGMHTDEQWQVLRGKRNAMNAEEQS